MKKKWAIFVITCSLVAVGLIGCSVTTDTPQDTLSSKSYEAFIAEDVITIPNGYVVEGDIFLPTMAEVNDYYDNAYRNEGSRSTVNMVNNQRNIWTNGRQLYLTYCISDDFGANKQKVVNAMQEAEYNWESCSNVDFIYDPSQDQFATSTNFNVVFNIRPATSDEEQKAIGNARSFFPTNDKSMRPNCELVLFKEAFTDNLNRIATHEFGHILGLRHEHIWNPAGNPLKEDNSNAQIINSYDSASIMYYEKNPGYTGNGQMTDLDRYGARALYPWWTVIPGNMKQVSVGADGTVWAVDSSQNTYRYSNGWNIVSQKLVQISVGSKDNVWGVSSDDSIWRWHSPSGTFLRVDGRLKHVSVAADGTVWGVNIENYIWRHKGYHFVLVNGFWNEESAGWEHIPGRLAQISVGHSNFIWGIAADGGIWGWNGTKFTNIGGILKNISVSADGNMWGVNSSNFVFKRNKFRGWEWVIGTISQISVGSKDNIWGVNPSGYIFKYIGK